MGAAPGAAPGRQVSEPAWLTNPCINFLQDLVAETMQLLHLNTPPTHKLETVSPCPDLTARLNVLLAAGWEGQQAQPAALSPGGATAATQISGASTVEPKAASPPSLSSNCVRMNHCSLSTEGGLQDPPPSPCCSHLVPEASAAEDPPEWHCSPGFGSCSSQQLPPGRAADGGGQAGVRGGAEGHRGPGDGVPGRRVYRRHTTGLLVVPEGDLSPSASRCMQRKVEAVVVHHHTSLAKLRCQMGNLRGEGRGRVGSSVTNAW